MIPIFPLMPNLIIKKNIMNYSTKHHGINSKGMQFDISVPHLCYNLRFASIPVSQMVQFKCLHNTLTSLVSQMLSVEFQRPLKKLNLLGRHC